MRAGSGKAKGGAFERLVCKELSNWVTGGKREDLFWRSAMSGGRATVRRARGKRSPHVGGDICAVHEDGNLFIDHFFVECKFYKSLDLHRVAFGSGGALLDFWEVAKEVAKLNGKLPLLIAKQNMYPPLMVLTAAGVRALGISDLVLTMAVQLDACICLWPLVQEKCNLAEALAAMPPKVKRPKLHQLPSKLVKVGGIGAQWL